MFFVKQVGFLFILLLVLVEGQQISFCEDSYFIKIDEGCSKLKFLYSKKKNLLQGKIGFKGVFSINVNLFFKSMNFFFSSELKIFQDRFVY